MRLNDQRCAAWTPSPSGNAGSGVPAPTLHRRHRHRDRIHETQVPTPIVFKKPPSNILKSTNSTHHATASSTLPKPATRNRRAARDSPNAIPPPNRQASIPNVYMKPLRLPRALFPRSFLAFQASSSSPPAPGINCISTCERGRKQNRYYHGTRPLSRPPRSSGPPRGPGNAPRGPGPRSHRPCSAPPARRRLHPGLHQHVGRL